MVKLSIIMPSLNVAGYIENCIKSVLDQGFDDIEILCIDAGSTDGTVDIINKYARLNNKIRLVHSKVKSYGYQVNLGIKYAKGDYIGIVETDDRISTDTNVLSVLYKLAMKYDLDSVRCNFYFCEHIGDRLIKRPARPLEDSGYPELYGEVICPSDYPKLLDHDWPIWSGLYRKKFLIDNNIWCNESAGAAYQDLGFSAEVYAAAERTMYIDKFYYLYTFDRDESSIRQNKSMSQVAGEYKRLFDDDIIEYNHFEKIRLTLDWKMILSFVGMTNLVLPMLDFDTNSGLFSEPYKWFLHQIEKEFGGDYTNNICEVNDETISQAKLLISNLSMYVNLLKDNCQRIADNRRTLVDNIEKKKGRVIIFGCGLRGKHLLDDLALIEHTFKKKIYIDAAVDNNSKLWRSSFCGVDIISPEDAVKKFNQDLFVIANKFHSDDISQQLHDMGLKMDDVFIYEP